MSIFFFDVTEFFFHEPDAIQPDSSRDPDNDYEQLFGFYFL